MRTIHSGVGAITENDVMLAGIDGAIIIGFNVRPDAKARDAANRDGIDIRYYRVIYQAIEDIEKAMKGMLTPEFRENVIGHAEVRNVFKITGVGIVAGSYVTDGKLQRNAQVRLLRDNVVVYEGKLSSLQRFKDAVKEVADGYECGVCLENYTDIKEGDVIECFVMEEIPGNRFSRSTGAARLHALPPGRLFLTGIKNMANQQFERTDRIASEIMRETEKIIREGCFRPADGLHVFHHACGCDARPSVCEGLCERIRRGKARADDEGAQDGGGLYPPQSGAARAASLYAGADF